MGNNPFQPPKRTFGLSSLLNPVEPESKPQDWFPILMREANASNQSLVPPVPLQRNPLRRISERPPFHITDEIKLAVWQKGRIVPGTNPDWVRMDSEGMSMWFSDYGNCESSLGWQADHIIPRSKGGSDLLANLQPLNWKNNLRKGDKVLPLRSPLSF